ncbi:hypothetical protein JTB14_036956 [Gonioctena quinquepunctata]|nr:hypothetical protein JTB14_036956 [Gonioctena quinquepunctata]
MRPFRQLLMVKLATSKHLIDLMFHRPHWKDLFEEERQNPVHEMNKIDGKYKSVFTTEQEKELVSHLESMESRLFGLTMKDSRSLAFQLAERNKLSHYFSRNTCMTGQDWIKAFHKRKKSNRHLDLQDCVSSEDSEEYDTECIYCGDFYSSSNEGWVSCQQRLKWANNSCAGIDSEDDETVLISYERLNSCLLKFEGNSPSSQSRLSMGVVLKAPVIMRSALLWILSRAFKVVADADE